jgi:hypothetical protein
LPDAITVEGFDLGIAWRATVESTNVGLISLEIRPEQPMPHRSRFMIAAPSAGRLDGDMFSTWPDGIAGPRWVIFVFSEGVRNMTLRYGGADRSILPVRIGTRHVPQLAIFSVTSHPAHVELFDEGDQQLAMLHLDDPHYRRNGQPRDLTAPAPIGPVTKVLST